MILLSLLKLMKMISFKKIKRREFMKLMLLFELYIFLESNNLLIFFEKILKKVNKKSNSKQKT